MIWRIFWKSAFVVTKVATSAVLSPQMPLGKDILAQTRRHTYRITVLTLYLTLKKCIGHMTQIFFQEFKKASSWYYSLHHVLNISAIYIARGNLDVAMRGRRFWEVLRNVTCNVVTCTCLTVLPQNILLTCPWYDLAAVGGTMQGGSQVPEELSVSNSHCTQTAILPTHLQPED